MPLLGQSPASRPAGQPAKRGPKAVQVRLGAADGPRRRSHAEAGAELGCIGSGAAGHMTKSIQHLNDLSNNMFRLLFTAC